LSDFFEGGLLDFVFEVAGQVGSGFAGKAPAGPRAPFALFDPRLAESVRIALEMDARIAEEGLCGRVLKDVNERLVRKGPMFENGFVSSEIGSPGSIEAEDGSRGKFLPPKDLAVFEAGLVEIGSAIVFVESIEILPIHGNLGRWQVGNIENRGGGVHVAAWVKCG